MTDRLSSSLRSRIFTPLPQRRRGSGVFPFSRRLSSLLALAAAGGVTIGAVAFLVLLTARDGQTGALSAAPFPTHTATAAATSTPTLTPTPLPSLTPSPTVTPPPTLTPTPSRPQAASPPTRIVIPAIDLDAPVLLAAWKVVVVEGQEVGQYEVPDSAAGFHVGSAYPGQAGNTVISGHHNLGAQVFRYLIDVEVGDEVILYVGHLAYHYRVTQKELLPEKGQPLEVRRQNARWIEPTADERLTLVTCWPYSGNSHRLILVAFPVP
ncbi:MAG: sortase [Anaerolineae bacterium]|nr:sortase [Anaerolineae bacterium]